MSHRRGAPSMDKECVIRRLWYAEAQKKEFKGSDSSSSDDEIQCYEDSSSKMEQSVTEDDAKEDKSIDNEEKPPVLSSPPPSRQKFSNFASTLGAESSNRIERVRTAEKFDKDATLDLDREIPDFSESDLARCLHKISNPPEPRAILICCGGFGDNGRMFQEFGAYFEERDVQLLSFTFPGKLHRVHEKFLDSIMDYLDWMLASLLHYGVVIRLEKDKRQGVLPDMPPITFFGHDYGSTVVFEMIRLLKKSKTVYLPVHHFISSACRPPEVLSEFNGNEKSRKYSNESEEVLMRRYLDLGFARPYMSKQGEERLEILRLYLPCFRSEYRALETYNFKNSIGRQGPALECDITVLGGEADFFAGGEQVLNKWRESTSGDCSVQMFENAGHFYWKHSDDYEERFLESVMEKLFPREGLLFDEKFLEVAHIVSIDEEKESAQL